MRLNPLDNFETPFGVYHQACEFFGIAPVLDVCATMQNTKCEKYFSSDALSKEWNMDFFMNNPYSQSKAWVKYAYMQHVKHNVNGLALLQSHTGTSYWHDYIFGDRAQILFWRGRIRFELDGVSTKFPPRFDSAFVCWRKKE